MNETTSELNGGPALRAGHEVSGLPTHRSESGATKDMRSIVARLGPAGVLGALWAIAPAGLGFLVLAYANTTTAWLRSFGEMGVWVYAGLFMLSAGLGLLPTYAQAVMGGFAFGFAAGLPAALVGFGGAALIGYEIARRASGERVMKLLDEHPKYAAARDALVGEGGGGFWRTLGIVTLVRVPFNSPFALTNLVLASVRVKRLPYLLGTLIGMTPRTALAVWIGVSASRLTGELTKSSISEATPKWVWVVGIVTMLAMVMVVSYIASKAMERVTGTGKNSEPLNPSIE